MKLIESKKKKGLCVAYRCKNEHAPHDRFCHKHRKRWQKENNLLAYTYNALKGNARRRKKDFTLTLEEFGQFCEKTGYLIGKGKTAESMSIDRIDPDKGYSLDNIQILSLSANTNKMNEARKAPF